jgi:D-beta-D-heptose 7-phosphate kinase/D-beta-D-heptose 1-phosphate adenosyltransferase
MIFAEEHDPMSTPIADTLRAMSGKRVLVVGDVMLDRFIYGRTERVSPEAPSLVLAADRQEQMLGGAANVAANIVALGAHCHLIGLCGADAIARELAEELARFPDIVADLIADPERSTTLKVRLVNPQYNTHLLRLDWEVTRAASGAVLDRLIEHAVAAVAEVEVVILSDYLKGVLQRPLIEAVATVAAARGIPVVVDPKGNDFARYRGVSVIAPNLHEVSVALGRTIPQEEAAIEQAAAEVSAMSGVLAIVVKRSQFGVQLVQSGHTIACFPTVARRVTDVSGAGDTLVAALSLALAANASLEDASRIANAAAGVAVAKKGTAAATPEELTDMLLHRHEHRFSPKLFSDQDALQVQVETWQRQGFSVGFTNGCFDLLHPGHVFTLTEARNRVDRLVLALNTDASVRRLKGPSRPVQNEVARMTVAAALESVDAVILFDTETPLDLIKALRPNVLFKGGDYRPETVVGRDEVEAYGGRVELIDYLPNTSTTLMIKRMGAVDPNDRGIGTGSAVPVSETT